jgi:hypothetical protein
MLRKSFVASSLVGVIIAGTTTAAGSAVPSKVIQGWQQSAPEVLQLTVLSKQEASARRPWAAGGGSMTTTDVTLTGKVNEVRRTASGVAPGSVITVRYRITRYEPLPGPPDGNQGIVLNVAEEATAYLKQTNKDTFELACPVGCLTKR